jgi:Carboxypeptidase regulatory-like domain/TonB dependent receptor
MRPRSALLCLALVCFLSSVLYSQTASTGALTVSAVDPSGATIPRADITVTSAGTGASRAHSTEANGSYTFSLLPPGTYKVTIAASGFKTVEIPEVTVNVSETHAINQRLEVGTQQQEVTVTTEAQALKTENSSLGDVVGSRQLNELPLVTRNYTQILGLSPGAIMDVNNASGVGRGSQWSYVNGLGNASNNYQMDGASMTIYPNGATHDPTTYFGSIPIPSPDALSEFKVQTSLYDAGYGRNAGANVNVVTKSGTNDIHGSLFEFFRNDDLNANDFFANRNGQPRPPLKQNQYGGTFGGAIVKDKLFYFLSFQQTRQVDGADTHGHSTVTLPAQLTNVRTAAALGAEFCPQNNPIAKTATFAGGTQVACDGSNINPIALNILKAKLPNGQFAIPAPQTILNPGTPQAVGFSFFTVPSTFREDQAMGNFDYLISSKQVLGLRYFYDFGRQNNGFGALSGTLPGSGQAPITGNHVATVRLTSTFTPSLVNEARFTYYHLRAGVDTTDPLTAPEVGIAPPAPWFPTLSPLTFVSPSFVFGGSTVDGARQPQTYYSWSDQISWSHGRHSIRAGFEGQHVNWLSIGYSSDRGSLTFQTFSDFLLGQSAAQNGSPLGYSNIYATAAGVTQPGGQILDLRANSSAAFIQDDFKISQHLTLNLGLRWEYLGHEFDADRANGGFDTWWTLLNAVPIPPAGGTYAGYTVANNYNGFLPPGVFQRSKNSADQNGAPWNNFEPRIGFAWQPLSSDKLVVRGGFGTYYNMINGTPQIFNQEEDPVTITSIGRSGAGNAAASFQNPYGTIPSIGWQNLLRTATGLTPTFIAVDQYLVNPLVLSYNLNVQYGFTPSFVLEVGYVGNRGERLIAGEALNVARLASPTSPLNCGLPSGCVTTNTAANVNQRVPIIGIPSGGISNLANVGDSEYSSLQVTLRKRFSRGLQFQGAYTFGRVFTDDAGLTYTSGTSAAVNSNDPNNRAQQHAQADFNREHRLVVNYTYDIPSYNQGQGFAGKLLSGWGLSGLTTVQSGLPINITDSRGSLVFAAGSARAEICPGETYANLKTPGSVRQNLNDYLNLSAICPIPVVGQVNGAGGATGYGNLGRNPIIGPGQLNFDAAAIKKTTVGGIHENAYLEFRSEFFNLANHPQFSNPTSNAGSLSTYGVISSAAVSPRIIQFALRYAF